MYFAGLDLLIYLLDMTTPMDKPSALKLPLLTAARGNPCAPPRVTREDRQQELPPANGVHSQLAPPVRSSWRPLQSRSRDTEQEQQPGAHRSLHKHRGAGSHMSLARAAALALSLPLLATAPAPKSSAGITVDEEGVMHNRGTTTLQPFNLDELEAVHSGTHDQVEAPDVGTSYRIHYEYHG